MFISALASASTCPPEHVVEHRQSSKSCFRVFPTGLSSLIGLARSTVVLLLILLLIAMLLHCMTQASLA